jgi:hypothetical protein
METTSSFVICVDSVKVAIDNILEVKYNYIK